MAQILKKSGVDWAFLTYGIIPTRCRDLNLKQFCLENIVPAILIILIAHIIIAIRWMLLGYAVDHAAKQSQIQTIDARDPARGIKQ